MKRRRAALLVVAVMGSAAAVQQALTVRDRLRYPAPGLLVHVDGRQIHLQVLGAETGGPTVVLESGMGSFSPNWYWVQQELAPRSEASPTTVQGLAGAGAAAGRGMPRRSLSNCGMHCARPGLSHRTCSPGTPSAACRFALSQIAIPS